MCEGGRDLEGTEPTEYCDSRLLDACDSGREKAFDDCDGGDVTRGGRARASWFDGDAGPSGEDMAGPASVVAIAITVFQKNLCASNPGILESCEG